MTGGWESSLEAVGAPVATALSPGSIVYPLEDSVGPEGGVAGISTLQSDQIPCISGIELHLSLI